MADNKAIIYIYISDIYSGLWFVVDWKGKNKVGRLGGYTPKFIGRSYVLCDQKKTANQFIEKQRKKRVERNQTNCSWSIQKKI